MVERSKALAVNYLSTLGFACDALDRLSLPELLALIDLDLDLERAS